MLELTWPQVNAWRVEQQFLQPRLPRPEFVEAARRVCGVQAQLMSAAELSLGVRTDGLAPADVENALWQDRTLVKTWAMRGTLHLLAADDLPYYVAARQMRLTPGWIKWFGEFGISESEAHAYFAALPQVLSAEPLTREELAIAVTEHTGVKALREFLIGANWGSPLKPAAFRGELCFGPTRGRNITFVHPGHWIGHWEALDPDTALQEIVRRYLRAYGPATAKDFAFWWGGSTRTAANKAYKALAGELEMVDVEGMQTLALKMTVAAMQAAEPTDVVRLLPLFDTYTIGMGRGVEQLLPLKHKALVFRPQGWITAVVLVGGRMRGVWEYKSGTKQTEVKVRLFDPPTAKLKKAIGAEAERLEAFWDTKVALEYADL